MIIVITPLHGWRRELLVIELDGGTSEQAYDAFVAVNAAFDNAGERDDVNVTLVPIGVSKLGTWIEHNVRPTPWERLTRKIRYSIHHMIRTETA